MAPKAPTISNSNIVKDTIPSHSPCLHPQSGLRIQERKMRTNTFLALQCFQCSTMQVKKSSNKWTCVVCNQKQSLRKVFAQGPMAKDIRFFVQSFNMSRKAADEYRSPDPQTSMPLQRAEDGARKRRSDWTEYLDLEPHDEDKEKGGDLGPRVLTELPKELFKKPKLKNYGSESNNNHLNNGGDSMLHKIVFSKRRTGGVVKSLDKEARKHRTAEAYTESKWSRNERQTETSQTTMAAKASKWSSYVTQDDDELRVGSARSRGDKTGESRQNDDVWETLMEDYKVEDDVHPDFM